MNQNVAKAVFWIGTLTSLILFLALTVDSHGRFDELANADKLPKSPNPDLARPSLRIISGVLDAVPVPQKMHLLPLLVKKVLYCDQRTSKPSTGSCPFHILVRHAS